MNDCCYDKYMKVLRNIVRVVLIISGSYSGFVLGILLFVNYVEGAAFSMQALPFEVIVPALLPSIAVAILASIYLVFTSRKKFTKILLIILTAALIVGGKWFYDSRYNQPLRKMEYETTITVAFTREAAENDVLEAVGRIEDIDGIKDVKYFSKEDLWEARKARLPILPEGEEYAVQYMPDGRLPVSPEAEIRTKNRDKTIAVANEIKGMFSNDLVRDITYNDNQIDPQTGLRPGWVILVP